MRGLPDHPGDKEYPREEWIDQGNPPKLTEEEQRKKEASNTEDASLTDQSGDYVVRLFTCGHLNYIMTLTIVHLVPKNYEISLSYQAQPGQSGDKLRSSNIHLMIEFFLGL